MLRKIKTFSEVYFDNAIIEILRAMILFYNKDE